MLANLILPTVLLLGATHAAAVPLSYLVDPTKSGFTGQVEVKFGIRVDISTFGNNSSIKANSHVGTLLDASSEGTVLLDWGAPSWSGRLNMPAGGMSIKAFDAGTASGPLRIDLGPINLDLRLDVAVDELRLGLASSFDSPAVPAIPRFGNLGPWAGADVVQLALGSQLSVRVSEPLTGLNFSESIDFGDEALPGLPMAAVLSREDAPPLPGKGSRLFMPVPDDLLSLSFAGRATRVSLGKCLIPLPFGQCALAVNGIRIDLEQVSFSVSPWFEATDGTPIPSPIPEPASALMLSAGLAGLLVAGRRRWTRAAASRP